MEMKFYRDNIKEPFLDNFIKDFYTFKISNQISTTPNNEHYCSDSILLDLIENFDRFDDYQKANDNKKLIHIDRSFTKKYNSKFVYFLQKKFLQSSIILSGNFLYPKNGYMGWHTNADTPYLRCYITYSENGDSYFKYRDPITKEIITDKDDLGWTLRYFKISNKIDELLWHCVYSNTTRISMGYRIINNLK
jgi:hypothetical protein